MAWNGFVYRPGESIIPEGGPKARLKASIDAVELSRELESSGRTATEAEMAVLAGFNGWGADKEAWDDTAMRAHAAERAGRHHWYLGEPGYGSWKKNYGELIARAEAMFSEDELRGIRIAGINSHFTDATVVHEMWNAVRRMGFVGGTVLEPTCGSGNIIGAMPEDMRDSTRVIGVELDSVTALVAKHLYPGADIRQGAFQEAEIADGSVDLVIGNVPFSSENPSGQTVVGAPPLNLHNYIIAHSLKKLKPGGLMAVVTTHATMENQPEQRKWLAKNTELLAAVRLPSGAFAAANTAVVTDILFIRKPDGISVASQPWDSCLPVDIAEDDAHVTSEVITVGGKEEYKKVTTAMVNRYFHANPDMVLGRHSTKGRMYGYSDNGQYTVVADKGVNLAPKLAAAIATIQEVPNCSSRHLAESEPVRRITEKPGAIVMENGVVRQVSVSNGARVLISAPWAQEERFSNPERRKAVLAMQRELRRTLTAEEEASPALPPKYIWKAKGLPRGWKEDRATAIAGDFIGLREAIKTVIETDRKEETTPEQSEAGRSALRERYQSFVKTWGRVSDLPLDRLFEGEPEIGMVMALEVVRVNTGVDGEEIRTVSESAILTARTVWPAPELTKPVSIQDAVFQVLSTQGVIMVEAVAERLGVPVTDNLIKRIPEEGAAYRDPVTGIFLSAAKYLSGPTRAKLAEARAAAVNDPTFLVNVAALERVVPPLVVYSDKHMSKRFGQTWIPSVVYGHFADGVFGLRGSRIEYSRYGDEWMWSGKDKAKETVVSREILAAYNHGRGLSGVEVFEAALSGKSIRVTWKDDEGKVHFDEIATNLAKQKAEAVREAWNRWLDENATVQKLLENEYNEKLNNMTPPTYDGAHLHFPTLGRGPGLLSPRPPQRAATARIIEEQSGLIAHDVGFGKTLTLCMSAMESKRLGLARKPLIVCDNASYPQFEATLRSHYPQATILSATPDSMSSVKRTSFLSQIATGDWDAVIMAQSHFDLIPNSESMIADFYGEQMRDLEMSMAETEQFGDSGKDGKRAARQKAKQLEKAQERLKAKLASIKERGDDCLTFDQLGIDLLFVDEAHKYKRISFTSSMERVKGIDGASSLRGDSMLMKARHLHSVRGNGRGVVFATATPVTNTMAEAWNMLRVCAPAALEAAQSERFDEFRRNFCETVTAVELHEASGRWKEETRLSRFANARAFINMIRSGMDVQNDPDKAGLVRPMLLEDKRQGVITPLSPSVHAVVERFQSVWKTYESMSGLQKKNFSYVPIMLINAAMTAAIDPRLVDKNAADDWGNPVNRVVDNVFRIWGKTREGRETQAVFVDRRHRMDTSKLDILVNKGIEAAGTVEVIHDESEGAESPADAPETVEQPDAAEIGDHSFDLYEDIKRKLIAKGVPAGEIAFAQDAKNDKEKAALFAKVNRGDIRVVIGSTQKMGVGVNMQDRLIALHHVDPPRSLTPADLIQRDGRVMRHGNENKVVGIYCYGMQDTATAGIYHRIQRKEFFVKQALAGDVGVEFEDCGSIDMEELKASMVSDKRVLRRAENIALLKDWNAKEATYEAGMKQRRRGVENATQAIAVHTGALEADKKMLERMDAAGIVGVDVASEEVIEVSLDLTMHGKCAGRTAPLASSIATKKPVEIEVPPLGNIRYKGPANGFKAYMDEYFKAWSKLNDERDKRVVSNAVETLAEGTVCGLPMRIASYQEVVLMKPKSFIHVSAFQPGRDVKAIPYSLQNGSFIGSIRSAKVDGGNSMLRHVANTRHQYVESVRQKTKNIEGYEADVAALKKAIAETPEFDYAPMLAVKAEIAAIEDDLKKNPVVRAVESSLDRYRNRGRPLVTPPVTRGVAAPVVGSVEAGPAPDSGAPADHAKRPSVKA